MRCITEGAMYVAQRGDDVWLCEVGRIDGFRLLPYQMTRRELARAVAEQS
ncbi:MAG: hypothetical protein QM775_10270 [Pirellulales bacterium]